jgi:hypothetical protein
MRNDVRTIRGKRTERCHLSALDHLHTIERVVQREHHYQNHVELTLHDNGHIHVQWRMRQE